MDKENFNEQLKSNEETQSITLEILKEMKKRNERLYRINLRLVLLITVLFIASTGALCYLSIHHEKMWKDRYAKTLTQE